jgi:hypothetical protein
MHRRPHDRVHAATSPISLAAMSDTDDQYHARGVVNPMKDPVVAERRPIGEGIGLLSADISLVIYPVTTADIGA